jgi:hypothetical protein
MTQHYEHDWPPTMKHHRRPRTVEILPPEQPRRIEVTFRRHRDGIPQWVIVTTAVFVMLVVLVRAPMGFVLLFALFGREAVAALVFGLVVCTLATIWNRWRYGRPF